jgi:hypothetical protein
MADYHPLIARAVAGLDKNSGENRRALYERARTALVAQLRGVVPPLDESEITRERLALEEAIRKVEAESARHARETARPAFVRRSAEAPRREEARREEPRREEPQREEAERQEPRREEPKREESKRDQPKREEPRAKEAAREHSPRESQPPAAPKAAAQPASPSPRAPVSPRTSASARAATSPGRDAAAAQRPAGGRRSLADEAMKGFRDVVSDPDAAAHAERHGPHAAETALPPAPSLPPPSQHPLHEYGQLEPQVQPDNLWDPSRDGARGGPPSGYDQTGMPPLQPSAREPEQSVERPRAPPRSYGGLIRIVLVLLLLLAAGAAAYWQREAIGEATSSIAALIRAPSTPSREASAPQRTKIPDRIGQPTTQPSPGPAVAQRVVLYEEDPDDPQGKRFVGAVVWRTETRPASPGRPPELAVRADIEVPDRKMTMTWSLRRNTDQSLPASHTIEIMFNIPGDSPSGGVQNVPGVLMKQAEQTRGVPLAGLAVKVTPGYFLIGLSALETDMQRNLQLLKDRAWFDIPIVYNNNRRAILAMEKGTPGERAFAEAFAAWKQ